MKQPGTQWRMLKDALRDTIDKLSGYRVKQAVFTTYAFEPEFFESSIVPLLLQDGEKNLSLHTAVRRLQLESILRDAPVDIDVYFDAGVVIVGCPLLPYGMKPIRLRQGEFHGKVVLLRLEDDAGHVRCILGAGSANLTQAGWWENIEAWHFTEPFDPSRPPAGVLPGVRAMLEFLIKKQQAGKATTILSGSFKDARALSANAGEPVFGVFMPGKGTFLSWLQQRVKRIRSDASLEVISPYFAEADQEKLVTELLEATRCKSVNVWLPIDPWQAGGPAARIERHCYEALNMVTDLRWCQMRDNGLAESCEREGPPRFMHAKVIRQPGNFCFVGSVNFSHQAFRVNFEAGFLFPDQGAPWLKPLLNEPERFLKLIEQPRHKDVDDDLLEFRANFNWQTTRLSIGYARSTEGEKLHDHPISILNAQGQPCGTRRTLPIDIRIEPGNQLYRDLQTNPWLRLAFRDGRKALVWVQQEGLEYRPLPADLHSDVWRILEMWRSLAGGRSGSQPGDFEVLEVLLKRSGKYGEAPPEGEQTRDIFGRMAAAHGSFYLLRCRLLEDKERRQYYFSAPRPDTLLTLVDKLGHPDDEGAPDAVEAWVILQWVTQICSDHKDLPSARTLIRRAEEYLNRLRNSVPLNVIEPKFLAWAQSMFQCAPGKEHAVARDYKQMDTRR
jgi:hypothetical protein